MVTQCNNKKYISFEIPLLYYPPTLSTSDQLQSTTTEKKKQTLLGMFSMDMACQMDIFWHYHYMLSANGTQVGIPQEAHHVIFSGLLQCLDGAHLEAQVICPLLLCYLVHQVCKRPLVDEELSAPLILAYITESHCPHLIPLGPLQPTL